MNSIPNVDITVILLHAFRMDTQVLNFMKMQQFLFFVLLGSIITTINCQYQNVPYGSLPEQVFDLYLPLETPVGDRKLIILIHGGAWGSGQKTDMDAYIPYLQESLPSHYIANMEYQLGTHASPGFPKQLDDISLAITYLKSTFTEDVTFALMGMSAGGHLSMLFDYAWDSGEDVKAVVSIVGPTDLNDPFYTLNPIYAQLFFDLVGPCLYTECPEQYNATSPVTYVHSGVAATIGFYGDMDVLVPNSQMPIMQNKLEELGVINSFTRYPGGHADWAWDYQMDMMNQIKEFLNANW